MDAPQYCSKTGQGLVAVNPEARQVQGITVDSREPMVKEGGDRESHPSKHVRCEGGGISVGICEISGSTKSTGSKPLLGLKDLPSLLFDRALIEQGVIPGVVTQLAPCALEILELGGCRLVNDVTSSGGVFDQLLEPADLESSLRIGKALEQGEKTDQIWGPGAEPKAPGSLCHLPPEGGGGVDQTRTHKQGRFDSECFQDWQGVLDNIGMTIIKSYPDRTFGKTLVAGEGGGHLDTRNRRVAISDLFDLPTKRCWVGDVMVTEHPKPPLGRGASHRDHERTPCYRIEEGLGPTTGSMIGHEAMISTRSNSVSEAERA